MNLEHQTTNSSPFFWALGKGMGALMGVSTLKRTHSSKSKKPLINNAKNPKVIHSEQIYFVRQLKQLKLVCLTLFITCV